MRVGALYLLLVAGVGALGMVTALRLVSEPQHTAVWVALAAAVLVQGPLGWWVIRAVGTPRFLLIWGFGLLTRLALVGLMAVAIGPALGLAPTPLLVTLVGLLAVLLMVEGGVALAALPRT